MNVKSIELQGGFMLHKDTDVSLPERGVVVVTGGNGSGKSALVEGVAYAHWGETLRGADPWTAPAGQVIVSTDRCTAARSLAKGKKRLAWARPNDTLVDYESTTKAQEALEQVVGPFDVWRRTHVFSSSDAAHFTLATDGERKRLIEAILGLVRFDTALEACRGDRAAADRVATSAGMHLGTVRARVEGERKRVADAEQLLAGLPAPADVTALRAKLAELGQLQEGNHRDQVEAVKQVAAIEDEARRRVRDLEQKHAAEVSAKRLEAANAANADLGKAASLKATADETERRLAALATERCDRCGQVVPQALRDTLRAEVDAARQGSLAATSAAKAARENAAARLEKQLAGLSAKLAADVAEIQAPVQESVAGWKSQVDELREEAQALQAKAHAIDVELAQHDQRAQQRARVQETWAKAAEALTVAQGELAEATIDDDAARGALATLQAVEQVLGLKGVRSQVIARSLNGIEQVANGWLARIADPGVTLHLKPYTEKKSGGVSDALSLEIVGIGGGQGYRALSAGQRRRVDVAMLLALAEVASAAQGVTPGTIWADEVFDALDGAGVELVSEVLRELALERCVVVITHNLDLAKALQPVVRLRVAEGRVTAA